ncbi:MAG: EsaB/YukD family protein [Candidatus Dormibacteraeota bacterium]|uniref:EsaB/YukD family protein n=1 Tax=Candidatus Amunia macphersoniae TaxID=3127014 RepID=A0A934KGD9_9BACT|nr:EsaB/YukD family protein [Candidatus Dormibacteraeota bacterium]
MRQSRVVLVTFTGPRGDVDVAARADVPIRELLPSIIGAVGDPVGDPSPGAAASEVDKDPVSEQGSSVQHLLDATLAEAGVVDGMILRVVAVSDPAPPLAVVDAAGTAPP